MASSAQSFTILSWTEDVEQLLANQATVTACCEACRLRRTVDLQRVLEARGARFSFWNRQPPCPQPGCTGRIWFYALRPGGSWKVIMNGVPAGYVRDLHERWHASLPRETRDRLPIAPMMHATHQVAEVSCAPCGHRFSLDEADVRAWGSELCALELREIFRRQCGDPACALGVDLAAQEPGTKKAPQA